MKRVLLLHDQETLQKLWAEALREYVDVVCAHSIERARAEFENNPAFDVIAVAVYLLSEQLSTESLVAELRAKFKGPIMAVSSYAGDRKSHKKAGCDYESNVTSVPSEVLKILKIKNL